jgi:serine/threonine protein kinase
MNCGALLSGLVLSGRFRIEALLGQGGMGAVYRATDLTLNRAVALKALTPGVGTIGGIPTDVRARFFREAQLAAQLDHPNIVPVLHFDSDGPIIYLVMPLLSGGTLSQRLSQRRPIDPVIALGWLRQIGAALDYAHQRLQPIIHRDVKPGNLLFHDDGRLCLADFGIARVATETGAGDAAQITRTGTILGSLQYMAPEQISGHAVPASDQYSTGVVLYEMLTGVLPFDSADNYALMMQHLSVTPAPPRKLIPTLPPGVDGVVLRALAKEPAQRFPTVSALAAAFEAALTGAPTAPVPGQAMPRLTRQIAPEVGSPPPGMVALPGQPPASMTQNASDPRGELPTRAATSLHATAGWAPTSPPAPFERPGPSPKAPPPTRRRNTLVIVLGSVLAVLLLCALGLAGLSQLRLNKTPGAGAAATASHASPTPKLTATPDVGTGYKQVLLAAEQHNPLFQDALQNNIPLWVLQNGANFHNSRLNLPGFQQEGGRDKTDGGGSASRFQDLAASFDVEIDVTFTSGSSAIYGFAFLSTDRPGYALALTSDGLYSVFSVRGVNDKSPVLLTSGSAPGLALVRESHLYHLAVLVQGNQIALFLEQQFVTVITLSSSFDTSHIFTLANFASQKTPGGDVSFRNLVIYPV